MTNNFKLGTNNSDMLPVPTSYLCSNMHVSSDSFIYVFIKDGNRTGMLFRHLKQEVNGNTSKNKP